MSIKEIYEKFVQSSGVITDSRKAKKNCIFFSLKGPNFNGNKFAKNAVDNGALIALVDEEKYALDNANYIYVKDCLETLQKLANFHRKKLKTKIMTPRPIYDLFFINLFLLFRSFLMLIYIQQELP